MVVVIFQFKFKLGQIQRASYEEESSVCAAGTAMPEPPAPSRPGRIPAPWIPHGEPRDLHSSYRRIREPCFLSTANIKASLSADLRNT